MIISRSPVRLTFAGGGTDIQSYYRQDGGFLIAGALNKYIWIIAHDNYKEDSILLKYSTIELAANRGMVQHPLFRECLKHCNITNGVELASLANVPPGCGLGTSGAFTVALLNALHTHRGENITKTELAEEACYIEINVLGEPIGKQDQYASAFGGVNCYTFYPNGSVDVSPLGISQHRVRQLNDNLLIFDTGLRRNASDVLSGQVEEMENKGEALRRLDTIKDMALETKELLEAGELDEWGSLLGEYWKVRKSISPRISSPLIDEYYDAGIRNGALGGKLLGAGAGGFLMFYCPRNKRQLINTLEDLGLKQLHYEWDWEGAKVWNL